MPGRAMQGEAGLDTLDHTTREAPKRGVRTPKRRRSETKEAQ